MNMTQETMGKEALTHKHHIIPRHFGGLDHAWNIAELTIEEHADAHRRLYEAFGSWRDKWAWKYLTWLATQDQKALRESMSIRNKFARKAWMDKSTPEERSAISSRAGKIGYKVWLAKMTREERAAIGKRSLEAMRAKLTPAEISANSRRGGKVSQEKRTPVYRSTIAKKAYEAKREKYTREGISAMSKNAGKKMKGKLWYNNGERNIRCLKDTQPEGFVRGRAAR